MTDNDQQQFNQPHEAQEANEAESYKARWLRAVADYQNLQKETARQRAEWAAMSEAQILEEFLPVYDHLKKAFAENTDVVTHANDADHADVVGRFQQWKKGIGFIMKQFGDILKAHGIEEIQTVGEPFDATRHESVGEEERTDVPEHMIVREVDGGYMMNGKVIKVAKVIVVKT